MKVAVVGFSFAQHIGRETIENTVEVTTASRQL
jgi:hypothetical protein